MNQQGTQWDKLPGNKEYFDYAEIFIQDRKGLLSVLKSFYVRFVLPKSKRRILDLGTGDGILVKKIFAVDKEMQIIAMDGSKVVLEKAKKNLEHVQNIQFIENTFEEIIAGRFKDSGFDFIMSSFAIHHLYFSQKKELFSRIFEMLSADGWFINIDTVTNGKVDFDSWYLDLWHEWIENYQKENNTGTQLGDIPYMAPSKPENHYDRLDIQLSALRELGFSNVECHYKYGLFAAYGGQKQISVCLP